MTFKLACQHLGYFALILSFFTCKQSNNTNSLDMINGSKSDNILIDVKENGVDYIFELIHSGPDELTRPNDDHYLELIKYKKGNRNEAKSLYTDRRKSSGIIAFIPRKDAIELTDLDKDGLKEFHFIYLVQKEELKPVEVNLISIIKGEDLMVSGNKTIDNSGSLETAYFTKASDSKYGIYNRVFKDFTAKKFDQFTSENGSKSPFIQKQSSHNSAFAKFSRLFPSLESNFTIKEEAIKTLSVKHISVSLATSFICDIPSSKLDCVLSPIDSETENGIDIRDHFDAYGKINKGNFSLLFYRENKKEYPRLILASYSKSGALNSRIDFSGKGSDSESVHGEIKGDEIYIYTTKYKFGHKGSPEHFLSQKKDLITISKDGKLIKNGKALQDNI